MKSAQRSVLLLLQQPAAVAWCACAEACQALHCQLAPLAALSASQHLWQEQTVTELPVHHWKPTGAVPNHPACPVQAQVHRQEPRQQAQQLPLTSFRQLDLRQFHVLQARRQYRAHALSANRHSQPQPAALEESLLGDVQQQDSSRPQRGRASVRLRRVQQQDEDSSQELQQQWRQHWQQQVLQQAPKSLSTHHGRRQREQHHQQRDTARSPGSSRDSTQGSSRDSNRHSSRDSSQGMQQAAPERQGSKQQAGQPPQPALDAIGITQALGAADSLKALQALLRKHSQHLQQIHTCAAYKAVVRLSVGLPGAPAHSQSTRGKQDQQLQRPAAPAGSSMGAEGSSSAASKSSQAVVDGSTALAILRQLSTRMQQNMRVARPWDLAQAAWASSKVWWVVGLYMAGVLTAPDMCQQLAHVDSQVNPFGPAASGLLQHGRTCTLRIVQAQEPLPEAVGSLCPAVSIALGAGAAVVWTQMADVPSREGSRSDATAAKHMVETSKHLVHGIAAGMQKPDLLRALLQYRDSKLLEAIAQQAQRKAAILTPHDISQLASAYARLDYKQPQLMQLLLTQAVAKAAAFRPWALVHTAWALHVCGQEVTELLEVAVPLLRDPARLQELNALDMSSLLWLLAGNMMYDEGLLASAAPLIGAHIRSYGPASTANTLMACAALGFSTPALSAAAAAAVLSGIQQQQYKPRQLALSVFALAKLQACDQQLLSTASAAFLQNAQAYSPPLLSMLVWVCVLSRQPAARGLLQEILQCSRQQLNAFSGDQLASLLRGLLAMPAQQGDVSTLLLSEAADLLPDKLPTVSTSVLTALIKSLSTGLARTPPPSQQQQQGVQQGEGLGPDGTDTRSAAAAQPATDASHQHHHTSSSAAGDNAVLLASMVQQCVVEWAKPKRVPQLTYWQAITIQRVLEGCGQEALAATAQQVAAAVQRSAQRSQQRVRPRAAAQSSSGAAAAAPVVEQEGSPAANTWVDSFVASTS